jgi:S1-C subfamily serine protease/regulator of sirC expression with transglutaminase-like and TPR domain
MPFQFHRFGVNTLPRRYDKTEGATVCAARRPSLLTIGVVWCVCIAGKTAGKPPEPPGDPPAGAQSIEAVVQRTKPAMAVISTTGRDGQSRGLGSGFVVAADGLVATNLHVIGEGRPITVQLADGRRFDVTAIHATDRPADLAVIRVNAKDLPVLPLGDSEQLAQGQEIVALGNPLGLRHSVVAGVVSARREVEGQKLIQLALPVEPGNSGGPVLDRAGRVQGIVSLKSAVDQNVGFAVEVNSLKRLLEKPNPVPIARWLTIGALDAKIWKPLFGATWRQRAGRITVEGTGQGFGGRSLCLHQVRPPEIPFELAVSVRLDDEAGAAGLVFAADGGEKHYGFYPTAGRLRLTRFEGADVFSWHVLAEKSTPHYRPGEWNTVGVRLEKGKITGSVNGHTVIEWEEDGTFAGTVGLAKFRDTKAQFKQFRVGGKLAKGPQSADDLADVEKAIDKLLVGDANGSAAADGVERLRRRADLLTRQAQRLREAADRAHGQRVCEELARVSKGEDKAIDLARAALVIAWLDNEELDVDAYVREVDRMAGEIQAALPAKADDGARLAALDKYLFQENGFHGSRTEYYHRSNSYLNEVIDDREGLPITLSVLYLELGRRLGLKIEGVGLPSHFVVRHVVEKSPPQLIDVFDAAKRLSRDDAAALVQQNAGVPLREEHLAAMPKRAILVRVLNNLLNLAQSERNLPRMLRYLDAMLVVAPDDVSIRGMRAMVRLESGRRDDGVADLDWIIEREPKNIDLERLRELRRRVSEGSKDDR